MATVVEGKRLSVFFEGDNLGSRERQIIGVLIALYINVLKAPLVAGGHDLTPEQERHIYDDVAQVMSANFPDLHFYVDVVGPSTPRPFDRPPFPT